MAKTTRNTMTPKAPTFQKGQIVVANGIITESGSAVGNPRAKFPAHDFIHAQPGDLGVVEFVARGDEVPTVRFQRRGHATIVGAHEVRVVGQL